MRKYLLSALLLFFTIEITVAQQLITISGVIAKIANSERIAGVLVKNLRTGELKLSSNTGVFTIKAFIGDTLAFTRNDYAGQKLPVMSASDMTIFLQQVIKLEEVTVKEKSKQQEIKDVVNTYRSKGIYYDGKPPLSAFSPFGGSPITGLYELFSKDTKNEKHFIKMSKEDAEAATVNRRYTKKLVKQVTALPDTDVIKFMQQYTPSFEDLKEWNDYELIKHIKNYLAYFVKRKDEIKLQKLY